jgi:hypothetical protein
VSTVTTQDHRNKTEAATAEGHPNNNEADLEQDTEQESESQNQLTESTYDVFQQTNAMAD